MSLPVRRLLCRLGLHKVKRIQIPVVFDDGIQPMFLTRHCEACHEPADMFANWRYPWEGKHRKVWR